MYIHLFVYIHICTDIYERAYMCICTYIYFGNIIVIIYIMIMFGIILSLYSILPKIIWASSVVLAQSSQSPWNFLSHNSIFCYSSPPNQTNEMVFHQASTQFQVRAGHQRDQMIRGLELLTPPSKPHRTELHGGEWYG